MAKVWLWIALYNSVWLFITPFDSVWLRITYDWVQHCTVWLYIPLYPITWLCITLNDPVLLCKHCITLYDSVWHWMSLYAFLFYFVWIFIMLYDCITQYYLVLILTNLCDSVWLSNNLYDQRRLRQNTRFFWGVRGEGGGGLSLPWLHWTGICLACFPLQTFEMWMILVVVKLNWVENSIYIGFFHHHPPITLQD